MQNEENEENQNSSKRIKNIVKVIICLLLIFVITGLVAGWYTVIKVAPIILDSYIVFDVIRQLVNDIRKKSPNIVFEIIMTIVLIVLFFYYVFRELMNP